VADVFPLCNVTMDDVASGEASENVAEVAVVATPERG
jgi:hypothetical protein